MRLRVPQAFALRLRARRHVNARPQPEALLKMPVTFGPRVTFGGRQATQIPETLMASFRLQDKTCPNSTCRLRGLVIFKRSTCTRGRNPFGDCARINVAGDVDEAAFGEAAEPGALALGEP